MHNLSQSLEDYLEAAYDLSRAEGFARSSRISERLKVSRPSVTSAVRQLAARGLLEQEPYGYIKLTPAGLKAGAEITGRHCLLKDFFMEILGMDEAKAETDACRAEHALSRGALARLQALAAHLRSPRRSAEMASLRKAISREAGL